MRGREHLNPFMKTLIPFLAFSVLLSLEENKTEKQEISSTQIQFEKPVVIIAIRPKTAIEVFH
jgi:hypothetical protein